MKKIVFGVGIVLAVLAVLTAPAAADYNIFHLVPENSSCNPGENVTVWVKVNTSYNDINAFQASIIFDPSVVNVTLVEEGTPDWYMWGWTIYNLYGYTYVKIGGADLVNTYGPGELELGKMTLHCEAPGISSLHFANESEVNGDRTEISHPDGVICGQAGNECTMEDGTFTCTVAGEETFSKDLVEGWNLVSLPLEPWDNSTSVVLSSMSGKYDAVYSYNAATKQFEDVMTGTMDPGIGYFVHVTTAGTWTYTGIPYTNMSVPLEQGLNMVGWLNCSKPIDNALSSIAGNYWYVARWNATSQKFETYNPVAPSEFNDFTTLERGEGYFISMKGAETLTAPC